MSVEVIEIMKEPTPELLRDAPAGQVSGIVFYPDDRLLAPSKEVPPEFFGEQLDKLVSDMVTTMYMCGGIGLSAIQIGVSLRVFVSDITALGARVKKGESVNQLLVAVNPVIETPEGSQEVGIIEGCLSFPGVNEVVKRPENVILRACSRKGEPYTLSMDGMLGRIIQHEMDHLDGKTFLDRMKPMAKDSARKAIVRFHKGVENDTIRVNPKLKVAPKTRVRKKVKRKKRR
ncbi:MAG: peptide deformylase [Deltaproteobacteria bacterium]|nr:peptide deformylase [Deltaproteobacteria bacterium]